MSDLGYHFHSCLSSLSPLYIYPEGKNNLYYVFVILSKTESLLPSITILERFQRPREQKLSFGAILTFYIYVCPRKSGFTHHIPQPSFKCFLLLPKTRRLFGKIFYEDKEGMRTPVAVIFIWGAFTGYDVSK